MVESKMIGIVDPRYNEQKSVTLHFRGKKLDFTNKNSNYDGKNQCRYDKVNRLHFPSNYLYIYI